MTVLQPAAGASASRFEAYRRWVVPLVVAGCWIIAVFFALTFVRRDAWRYVDWSEAVYQRFWPNRWLLAVHVAGAGIALLAGPAQFSKTLRKRLPRVHRIAGWVYVCAVLISTPFAMRLANDSCVACVLPFEVWGFVTLVFTAIAVMMAIMGNYKAHRDFMIRSYVMMYAFVIVRLDGHLLGTPFELPGPMGFDRGGFVIWYAWVIPLLAVEASIVWFPTVQRVLKRRRGPVRTPASVGR